MSVHQLDLFEPPHEPRPLPAQAAKSPARVLPSTMPRVRASSAIQRVPTSRTVTRPLLSAAHANELHQEARERRLVAERGVDVIRAEAYL
jgi:hypothetical protein